MTSMEAPASERGHPKGLYVLFFTEMWERFCYYGMRALLALYVAAAFFDGDKVEAAKSYGAFTALVYATGIFSGMVADKLLGYVRSIYLGGLFIAAGEFTLLIPDKNAFLLGLALMIVGNGLFKPNISTIVGKLYEQGDPRRDRGFTIFYMGINLGALLAPLVCGLVTEWENFLPALEDGFVNDEGLVRNYRYGFALAGVGMLVGLLNLRFGQARLGGHGDPPAGKEGFGMFGLVLVGGLATTGICYAFLDRADVLEYVLYSLFVLSIVWVLKTGVAHGKVQLQKLIVLVILLFANTLFWALFEQAGNSFNFLAEEMTDRNLPLGLGEFKTAWYQSVNPFLIVVLAPVFVWIWKVLGSRDPSIPAKFGLALIQLGLGFTILLAGMSITPNGTKMAFYFLMLTYLLHTMGELCLSPIGLSMVTKLAPAAAVGFVMGAWFMSISVGNFIGGQISKAVADAQRDSGESGLAGYQSVFTDVMIYSIAAGVALLLLARPINKWMHGVK
jgi:POT family proton-dependent oligopeptide transporter